MTLVSYAQNFEDVMLWRALRHVGPGVYVDVGAQHPVIDSVSKAFYEQGWRGVHIEPVSRFAELLRADRPDETVLQVALSDREGTLELNVIAGTGLSTAVDHYAERHQLERGFAHQRVRVPTLTLASALGQLAGQQVHWLKIDVEGFEAQVLRGWDSTVLRPWIIVVEATVPNSTAPDYQAWDPILVAADYRFVYFDGLNRFYVAAEHADLASAFAAPPNVFDDFELSGQASWKVYRRVQDSADAVRLLAAEQLADATHQTAEARRQIAALAERADALENALEAAELQREEQSAQTHRWWGVADAVSGELRAIRAGRSYRLARALQELAAWPGGLVRAAARRLAAAGTRGALKAQGASEAPAPPAPVLPNLSQGAARHLIQLSRALESRKT